MKQRISAVFANFPDKKEIPGEAARTAPVRLFSGDQKSFPACRAACFYRVSAPGRKELLRNINNYHYYVITVCRSAVLSTPFSSA
jgi:hypothetical protein